jgi:hypothetical protein
VAVELSVQAAPWIDLRDARLILNGTIVRHVPVQPGSDRAPVQRLVYTTELGVERSSWLVAVVWGATPFHKVLPGASAIPMAFTNPIYLEPLAQAPHDTGARQR